MNLLNSLNQILDSTRAAEPRDRERGNGNKTLPPAVERLESLCLLSTLQTITEPTISLAPTPTDFGPPLNLQPAQNLTPSLPLFDPKLGTLVGVEITGSAQLTSQLGGENLSHDSATTINASSSGNYEVDGLGTTPISNAFPSQALPPFAATTFDGVIDYGGTSGHTYAPTTTTSNVSETLTTPADLAFFTAAPGHTSITATMSASAQSDVTDDNGNLAQLVRTEASSQFTVTYQFQPPPSVVNLCRYGVHREQTQLILTVSGPLNAAEARNLNNYLLVRRGADGQFTPDASHIDPIKEVVYNPKTKTVTLVPTHSLNVREFAQLTVKGAVFGPGEHNFTTVFGGKASVCGFVLHHSGRFYNVVNGQVQHPATNPPPGFLKNV